VGKDEAISVGSWIRIDPLWPGIWRVSRILSDFDELRWNLDKPVTQSHRSILFCDRIVNDNWKQSFNTRSCEISLVGLLNAEDSSQLKSLLSKDLQLQEAFEKYQSLPHPIDLIANVPFGGMSEEIAGQFTSACDEILRSRIDAGLTVDELLELLKHRGLLGYQSVHPKQVSLQFTCVDHEVRAKKFVFRKYRLRSG